MKKLLLIFLVFLAIIKIDAQQRELDSLLIISKNQNGKALVASFNEISWHYRNIQADTALLYAKKALIIASKVEDESLIASAYHNMASAFQTNTLYDSAQYYHKKVLP